LTAAGIILGYLLMDVHPEPGKTMNAVLAERLAGSWSLAGIPVGNGFVVITLTSEALLLFVAAQAGFIDGPRVMANMAHDSWLTVAVTGAGVTLSMLIKRHDLGVRARLGRLDQILAALTQTAPKKELELQKKKPTAVLLVGGFSGLGIHALLTIMRLFPRYFVNVVFMSVGVIDSATFQGVEEVDRVRDQTEEALRRYVDLARGMGIPAD